MFELGTEGLKSVIHALSFSFGKVSVCLDLALDVLKFCLKLLLRLDSLHQHHIVVAIHLNELVVHGGQWYILVLLSDVACHVFLDQLLLRSWHPRFHEGIASGDKCGRTFHHFYLGLNLIITGGHFDCNHFQIT